MGNRRRHLRITLLRILFLIGIGANLAIMSKGSPISPPMRGTTLSELALAAPVDRFVPIALYDHYHARNIVISHEILNELELEENELERLARIDTVHVIDRQAEGALVASVNEVAAKQVEYRLPNGTELIFLLASTDSDVATVAARHRGNAIIFFPLNNKDG